MKLALRRGPALDANWLDKAASVVINIRLMTDYTHAGIVIGDTLYHATARKGLNSEKFNPERWTTFELGDGDDAEVLDLFKKHEGSGYDWFSLLAFALVPARDSQRWYCYEWCYYAMTGENPRSKVTPETLLQTALEMCHGIPAVH